METLVKKIIAVLTAGSMTLAAVPVGANGLSANAGLKLHTSVQTNAGVGWKLGVEAKTEAQASASSQKGLRLGSDVSAEAKANAEMDLWMRMRDHLMQSIKRAVHAVAKITKRICGAKESTDSAVKACVQSFKVDFSAKVQAMIDVAFGS